MCSIRRRDDMRLHPHKCRSLIRIVGLAGRQRDPRRTEKTRIAETEVPGDRRKRVAVMQKVDEP